MTATQLRGLPTVSLGPGVIGSPGGDWRALLRVMLLARSLERHAPRRDSQPARRQPGNPGAEAMGAGVGLALRPDDFLLAPLRYASAHLGHGVSTADWVRGAVPPLANSPTELLAELALGVGLALTRESDRVALAVLPAGPLGSAGIADAWRVAAANGLPLVLVVEQISPPPVAVDGAPIVSAGEPEAIFAVCREAAERARTGAGPALIACEPLEDGETDPLAQLTARLTAAPQGREQLASLRREVGEELGAALQRAGDSAGPAEGEQGARA